MKNAQELAEVNQGDDDPDDDALITPQPTRREVLQATSTIHQYINTLNDPLARKLEGLLSSFRHQLCFEAQQSNQVAEITSYFAPKYPLWSSKVLRIHYRTPTIFLDFFWIFLMPFFRDPQIGHNRHTVEGQPRGMRYEGFNCIQYYILIMPV